MTAWDDEDEAIPTVTGRADVAHDDVAGDDLPGLYIPDPESRNGWRIWWVKRPKPNGPPSRQMGFKR